MIRHLLVIAVCGFFAHFTYYATSRLSNGYSQLAAYTVGVTLAYPAVEQIHEDLEGIKDRRTRLAAAYFLAYLAFGAGTGIGWQAVPMDHPIVPMLDDAGIR